MKKAVHLLLRTLFKLEGHGTASLQAEGPLLLVPNHVSWLDWLFLLMFLGRDWRFVVSQAAAETSWLHRLLMLNWRTFAIDTTSPYAVKRMAQHLQAGGKLVLFAEGRITFTGNLMKLFEGTGFLLVKSPARVITCYLRGADRLKLSRNPGWRRWFPKVTAHFGEVLQPPELTHLKPGAARTAYTEWLHLKMVEQQFQTEMRLGARTLPEAILETALIQPDFEVLEDFAQKPLIYKHLLASADALAESFDAVLPRQECGIGVLLPNINANPVTLLALWFLGRTPSIFNFSTGLQSMLHSARLANVGALITSREFLKKARLDLAVFAEAGIQIVHLEDLKKDISTGDRLSSVAKVRLSPEKLLRKRVEADSPAVILFTSGSEGVPKGVVLSHGNLLANIRQMLAVNDLNDSDRIFNALPIFHSFGLTVGTLLGLVRGSYVFLYPSPLHYRIIPNVLYDKNCTVFLSTNTFLNGYHRRAHSYDFRSVRCLFAAAEKVQETTFASWSQRFGVRILEGYGATECSPTLSVNVGLASRHGSAGRFLPGIEWRIEEVPGVETGGRLLVRGPNIMKGYLHSGVQTPVAPPEGWYDTGDIVRVDAEGFLYILGRVKRFAKVGGEMVSLTAVEEALAGAFPQHGTNCQMAVVSRVDAKRGETLVAITTAPKLGRNEVRLAIQARGLSNLCVPAEVRVVGRMPVLGSGKTNYRELQKLLEENSLPLADADAPEPAFATSPDRVQLRQHSA
jgi:acyl-[acyl-carrier-protein]-phospholipid O-acyltransferase/long-chain-fatty-acid--[acyl-carrier-protein] ligase